MFCKLESRGFTLVEIIAVVAVIAILTVLAVMSSMNAGSAAATKTCKANLWSLDAAIQIYAIHNSGTMPGALSELTDYFKEIPTQCPADGDLYIYADGVVTCPNGHTLP